jgi:phosphoglycolate phosphatase-like HAD superfamily hydrolase
MNLSSKYKSIIFDCDGVLLDSNKFKISAMRESLIESSFPCEYREQAVISFKNNFGRSRFHHVEEFIRLLGPDYKKESSTESLKSEILCKYTSKCKKKYPECGIIEGAVKFLESFNGNMYVASGSAEFELQEVLKKKGISKYFRLILGSPEKKSNNIRKILSFNKSLNTVMIGDSEADYFAAKINCIDFIFFAPYSNTKDKMLDLASVEKFQVINSYSELRDAPIWN